VEHPPPAAVLGRLPVTDSQITGSKFASLVKELACGQLFLSLFCYAASMEAQFIVTVRDQALDCHRQAAAAIDATNEIADETIHALRVQTKRLRAYWELLYPVVGKSLVKSATQSLRQAASRFSAARDHHVMVTLLGKLAGKAKKPKVRSALADALKAIVELTPSSGDPLPTCDEMLQIWRRDQDRWESLRIDSNDSQLSNRKARKGLQRIFKKARNLHQRAVAENEIEHWHALRKWVKYLSLTVPLCGDDPATAIAAKEWARLGKSLGKLHDHDELVKRIAGLGPDQIDASQSARAIRWIAAKRDRLCVECDMHARRLLAQRPAPFVKTLIPD